MGVIEIPLRRRDGSIRAVAIVGNRDAWVREHRWYLHGGAYAARRMLKKEGDRIIYLHRAILARMGHPDCEQGDHRDRNPLNNLRSNLRPATAKLNAANRYYAVTGSARPEGNRYRVLDDPPPRPCAYCGTPFVPRRKTANLAKAKYCSRKCQRRACLRHDSRTQRVRSLRRHKGGGR